MHLQNIGTRAQVWHGTARKTSGGLTKKALMKNKAGRIVSRAKHNSAKKEMRLLKFGYGTKKGEFGFVKLRSSKRRSRKNKSRRMRGGMGLGSLNPAEINSDYMIKNVVPQHFGPLERALVGGRRRSRQQQGGYHGNAFSPADAMGQGIDGQGITNYNAAGSVGVQEAAGMAGGRRRRHRHRRMQGGTGNRTNDGMGLGSAQLQLTAGNA